MPSTKRRSGNAEEENTALTYIRGITDREHHIFRRVLEEDVGIDAHIELCHHEDEPTGAVVALQVKSGESYIHAETSRNFVFRPTEADLRYWQSFALPVYLVVYRPTRKTAYRLDVKEACEGRKFDDMLAGVAPKKLVFRKSNVFSKNFFPHVVAAFDTSPQRLYSDFLASAFSVDLDPAEPILPIHIHHLISMLDVKNADPLLHYLVSRRDECTARMMEKTIDDPKAVKAYLDELTHALSTRVFESEGTGFVLMAFQDAKARDAAPQRSKPSFRRTATSSSKAADCSWANPS